jgi:hypothetical protein
MVGIPPTAATYPSLDGDPNLEADKKAAAANLETGGIP